MSKSDDRATLSVDEHLRELISADLLLDERVSVQNITVNVRNRTATLTGTVSSFRRKLAAQQIVNSYDGIREVRNELVVAPAHPASDEETAEAVRASLDASADLVKETVTVEVSGGKVTLTGTVGSAYERACAEDITRGVRGVRDVINMLTVDLKHRIDDHELMNSVRGALSRARGLSNEDVRVAIADDTVVLSGVVSDPWKREVAETAVGRFGFVHIRNEIQVGDGGC